MCHAIEGAIFQGNNLVHIYEIWNPCAPDRRLALYVGARYALWYLAAECIFCADALWGNAPFRVLIIPTGTYKCAHLLYLVLPGVVLPRLSFWFQHYGSSCIR